MLGLANNEKRKKGTHVELWMGISTDEEGRMKPNRINWLENKYPLIEKGLSRKDCIAWFKKHYDKTPPRSACTFCPYKTNKEWKDLKDNYPEEWKDVVEFDKAIRQGTKGADEVFIHRYRIPISDVKLIVQGDLDFDEVLEKAQSCEGMCGL